MHLITLLNASSNSPEFSFLSNCTHIHTLIISFGFDPIKDFEAVWFLFLKTQNTILLFYENRSCSLNIVFLMFSVCFNKKKKKKKLGSKRVFYVFFICP